jgi:tRNA(fMet)-specific endonuclease VapC
MSLWVLDTDHVSLFLRGNPRVIARLSERPLQTVTTIITVQEVFNGWVGELNQRDNTPELLLSKYRELSLAVELFRKVPVLEFDRGAFESYERLLRGEVLLRKRRLQQDVRIAAIALSRNAIVVTRNQRDFALVPGLVLENWME